MNVKYKKQKETGACKYRNINSTQWDVYNNQFSYIQINCCQFICKKKTIWTSTKRWNTYPVINYVYYVPGYVNFDVVFHAIMLPEIEISAEAGVPIKFSVQLTMCNPGIVSAPYSDMIMGFPKALYHARASPSTFWAMSNKRPVSWYQPL